MDIRDKVQIDAIKPCNQSAPSSTVQAGKQLSGMY